MKLDAILGNSDGRYNVNSAPSIDFVELVKLREQMLYFATLDLVDSDLAEDAVQEAFMTVLEATLFFDDYVALKARIFPILKSKITSLLNQRGHYIAFDSLRSVDLEDDEINEPFDQQDHWQIEVCPPRWQDPQTVASNRDFWTVFGICLNRLPERQAMVFMMREFIELENWEICAAADITLNNLNVILHRAKLRLRKYLESKWFI
ncbi:sigma-70 family RNA polymerase sigma factor [Microbulbifer discodermiae]|uniref:sigma-70 family RNA polymerase sigma factor n=1 Tax=Microbulbifer sp. 2201CG32-9 TaxID=3232309 RepID=UPI00345C3087